MRARPTLARSRDIRRVSPQNPGMRPSVPWPPARRNAALGALGIFLVGIFLTWFPVQALHVPQPAHPVHRTVLNGLWQTLWIIVMPYAWASARLGKSPADLGLSRRNLLRTFLLGCGLYALAMAAFVAGSHDPLIRNHPVRHLPPGGTLELGFAMCLIAAGTDVATRGFILLTLLESTGLAFAILMQNVFWLLGHTNEIRLLQSALGREGALGLFVLLGLLGDSIVLRTRNVLGLGLAHALLNIVMIWFIRTRL